jgi:hypothetical protein
MQVEAIKTTNVLAEYRKNSYIIQTPYIKRPCIIQAKRANQIVKFV